MPNTQLNPDALEAAAKALLAVQQPEVSADYAWNVQFEDGRDELRNEASAAVSAYLAVAQPVVNSVEELDALPVGTVIMATGGRWNPGHPELFLKCGYAHAPWMALDPSDRDDGENLESSGAVLRWRCDGEARVLYRPEVTDG
ncbi:hypothetical protein [Glutamicibacter halophytocola]|uniref:hypothetical protein n=1 Tax=Glutamicibacter halophytocola TaxID=1933880 RepID=UPI0015C5427E|nr:hypothetical protein [Glutamicibacter halophytocola]NQD40528.1 hypothetical protein [Glutamicibacter halophytocola]